METALQIQTALRSHSVPVPSQSWLLALVQAQSQATLGALIMTARTRILACDLTTPNLLDSAYLSAHTFPIQITSPAATNINEIRLNRDVVVQILDIENLNRSRWDQVEELESIERGEQTRGRQVIRLPTTNNDDDDDGDNQAPDLGDTSDTQQLNTQRTAGGTEGAIQAVARERERQARNATHKLVLQDAKGKKMFGLELKRMDRIMVGTTCIGEKLLLKTGTVVARGVLLLEPGNCQILGGKVEAWHKEWTEGRLARLRQAVGADAR